MSGGSWDYLCFKMDDAADRLINSGCLERRAFGHWMQLAAVAMKDIEWVDSSDKRKGSELQSIRAVLDGSPKQPIDMLRDDVDKLIRKLEEIRP